MTIKTLTGAYAGGYTLKTSYSEVELASTATVGGTGLAVTNGAYVVNMGSVAAQPFSHHDGIDVSGGGGLNNGGYIFGYNGVRDTDAPTNGRDGNYGVIKGSNDGFVLLDGGVMGNFGTIFAGNTGIYVSGAAGNIANTGLLVASSIYAGFDAIGVNLAAGGILFNSGLIQADTGAILSSGSVDNSGTIQDVYLNPDHFGVLLNGGASLTNGAQSNKTALIEGFTAVSATNSASTISNFGTIQGSLNYSGGSGVYVNGGKLANGSGGDVTALVQGYNAVAVVAGGTVTNDGTISGTMGSGILFLDGGRLTNGLVASHAALVQGYRGVTVYGAAATITNYGTVQALGVSGQYGVSLTNGGQVINGAVDDTAALIGGVNGVGFGASGQLVNYATIDGATGVGVAFASGGSVVNGGPTDRGALIEGLHGVTGASSVANFGTIDSASATSGAVVSGAGAQVINGGGSDRTALIQGALGVEIVGGSGVVENFATVAALGGAGAYGVYLHAGGALVNGSVNNAAAMIEGYGGVELAGPFTASNFGTITAQGDAMGAGAQLTGAGALTNGAAGHGGATIEGYTGVQAAAGATVTNFGSIIGQGGTAVTFAAASDTLVVEAGSVFTGAVLGGGGTLELGSGAGVLTGLLTGGAVTVSGSMATTTFNKFNTVQVDAPASFSLSGAGAIAASQRLVVAGTLIVANTLSVAGSLTTSGTLTGAGTLALAAGTARFNKGTSLTIANVVETGAAVANVTANLTYAGAWTQTAGSIVVATGAQATLTGVGDSFSGALTGAGAVAFNGGTDTFAGTTLSASGVTINGATVTLSGAIANTTAVTVTTPSMIVAAGGASLTGSGTVALSNAATNEISGATATATLTNVGNTISGAGLLGGGQMILVNQAAGVIDGNDALGLTIDTGAKTITNAGLIEATAAGGVTINSAVNNTGTLEVDAGVLTVRQAVTGTGQAVINGGTLDMASSFSQKVTFGASGMLELAKSQGYTGSITGFSTTSTTSLDLLDIAFVGAGEAAFSGTKTGGVLTVTDGTHTAHIALKGNYLSSTFTASSDGRGGTIVVDPTTRRPSPVSSAGAAHQFIAAMAGLGGGPGGMTALTHDAGALQAPMLVRPHTVLA